MKNIKTLGFDMTTISYNHFIKWMSYCLIPLTLFVNSRKRISKEIHLRDSTPARKQGMSSWKEDSNYHRRSLLEIAMYRFKSKFTEKLAARDFKGQVSECIIKCAILNKLPTLRP